MTKKTNILNKRWKILLLSIISYWLWPLTVASYYYENSRRHMYPINSDSISIPIFEFTISWIIWFPIYLLIVLFSTRKYLKPINLFIWSNKISALAWSFFYGFILIMLLYITFYSLFKIHIYLVMNSIFQMYVMIILRAVAIHKK